MIAVVLPSGLSSMDYLLPQAIRSIDKVRREEPARRNSPGIDARMLRGEEIDDDSLFLGALRRTCA